MTKIGKEQFARKWHKIAYFAIKHIKVCVAALCAIYLEEYYNVISDAYTTVTKTQKLLIKDQFSKENGQIKHIS